MLAFLVILGVEENTSTHEAFKLNALPNANLIYKHFSNIHRFFHIRLFPKTE